MTTRTDIPQLPKREADSHKGSYGEILIIAGSLGMAGAVVLVGSACLRSGAGLVRVATPKDAQPTVAAGNPSLITIGLGDDPVNELQDVIAESDVIAVGPGLGQTASIKSLVQSLIQKGQSKPMVLDADALNVLAPLGNDVFPSGCKIVLTPHPGEFARLIDKSVAEVQANREELAGEFARRHNVILVLKGNRTIVTDGASLYVITTGNPGMAVAGMGDVLTGIIAGLLGVGLSPMEAAILGVHVHGRAGDAAAKQWGQTALTAPDVIDSLGSIYREMEQS